MSAWRGGAGKRTTSEKGLRYFCQPCEDGEEEGLKTGHRHTHTHLNPSLTDSVRRGFSVVACALRTLGHFEHGHFYTHADKKGALFSFTTYPPCQPAGHGVRGYWLDE